MSMVGADAVELHQLARTMENSAIELDRVRTGLNSQLGKTTWNGPDRTEFLSQWVRQLSPTLKSSSEILRNAARALHKNGTEQEWASASNAIPGSGFFFGVAPELRQIINFFDRPQTPRREGDRGGTFEWEPRGSWEALGDDPSTAGRGALARALEHTADQSQIAQDEFEIVALENGKYIVVLPGVTDLTKVQLWATASLVDVAHGGLPDAPPLGLDRVHRSARDLDRGAFPSARGSAIGDNLYAQYVVHAMRAYGIPNGAEVTIVGHSYGADTAIDLATDRQFNGGTDGYRITHVLAAGYYSEPALTGVPSTTNVLAIQNNRDLVVLAERAGEGPLQALDGLHDVATGAVNRDVGEVWKGGNLIVDGSVEVATDAAKTGAEFGWDLVTGYRPWNMFGGVGPAVDGLLTTDTGTTVTADGHVNIVFDGGGAGVGHHPSNYVDYLVNSDADEVVEFARSLADSGYTVDGVATAHDVSVPD